MEQKTNLTQGYFGRAPVLLAVLLIAGCQSGPDTHADRAASNARTMPPMTSPATTMPITQPASSLPPGDFPPQTPPPAPSPAPAAKIIRIKAGVTSPFTDAEGNVWLPDQGFADGETTERAEDLQIANTKTPAFYRTERYLMSAFSWPLPNGKYTVKLYFAETYEGITGPGERVFSFNVEGKEFKDFDIWVKAGGPFKAYIETVNVEITDGKLDITFTPKAENPEINGIEIIPAS